MTTMQSTTNLAAASLPDALAFKRILVPLDGSLLAEQEIPVAARIALASRASVLLVRVVNPPAMLQSVYPIADDAFEASVDVAIDYLHKAARQRALADVEVHTKVLTGASGATRVSTSLCEAIELYDCDLVVIGSHRRTGLARMALGSVARQLVRHATVPVLVLPANARLHPLYPASTGVDATLHTLVPLDGSALAEASLMATARVVTALSGRGRAVLHLLRIVDPGTAWSGKRPALPYREATRAALEEARAYLSGVATRLREGEMAQLDLRVETSVAEDVDTACAILDEAAGIAATRGTVTRRYNLIGMGTHGRTGMRRLALGSVAECVLADSGLPLLFCPATSPEPTSPESTSPEAL